MKRFDLIGVNTIGEPVKLAKDVSHFIGHNDYFRVEILDINFIKVTTPKGSYTLPKHPVNNIYMGEAGGVKFHITLKKIVGEVIIFGKAK